MLNPGGALLFFFFKSVNNNSSKIYRERDSLGDTHWSPLKLVALQMFSIVPYAASVEWLFSDAANIEAPHRTNLKPETLSTLAACCLEYCSELGLSKIRRQHQHMHTQADHGSNLATIIDLRVHEFNHDTHEFDCNLDPASLLPTTFPSTPFPEGLEAAFASASTSTSQPASTTGITPPSHHNLPVKLTPAQAAEISQSRMPTVYNAEQELKDSFTQFEMSLKDSNLYGEGNGPVE